MADDQEHVHEHNVQSRKNEHGQYEYRTVCECGDVQWDWHL